jgi:hypothetical protein
MADGNFGLPVDALDELRHDVARRMGMPIPSGHAGTWRTAAQVALAHAKYYGKRAKDAEREGSALMVNVANGLVGACEDIARDCEKRAEEVDRARSGGTDAK